jgi:hypothetical protein
MKQAVATTTLVGTVLFAAACCAQVPFTPLTSNGSGGGNGGDGAMPASPGIPVSDAATETNTYLTALSLTIGGMPGLFDPTLELDGDLEQQVSSTGGLPLDLGAIAADFPPAWPGYSNGQYNQDDSLGSPEGDMALTLGTFQGALQAGADQQTSQPQELSQLSTLEAENVGAESVFQLLEIQNEIALLESELGMKERNATNAQLNSINVMMSNQQNKVAQDELLSLADATELSNWDMTNIQEPEPTMPDPGS